MIAPADTDIDLSRLMTSLVAAQESACVAHLCTRMPGRAQEAAEHINAAQKAVETAIGRLQSAGVPIGGDAPREVIAASNTQRLTALDLSALSSLALLDTPAARNLLDALRGVLPAAEAVDRERGAWYENAPATDTKGCDFAEDIHHLICRLELELSGPRSRRGE